MTAMALELAVTQGSSASTMGLHLFEDFIPAATVASCSSAGEGLGVPCEGPQLQREVGTVSPWQESSISSSILQLPVEDQWPHGKSDKTSSMAPSPSSTPAKQEPLQALLVRLHPPGSILQSSSRALIQSSPLVTIWCLDGASLQEFHLLPHRKCGPQSCPPGNVVSLHKQGLWGSGIHLEMNLPDIALPGAPSSCAVKSAE